jgi:hypothetical protein
LQQKIDNCEGLRSDDFSADVEQGRAIQPPIPIGPVCNCPSTLAVAGLRPGAIVSIQIETVLPDGSTVRRDPVKGVAWASYCEFELAAGQCYELSEETTSYYLVSQKLCKSISFESRIQIRSLPEPTTPPIIVEPLYACQRRVKVGNIAVGSMVTLYSNSPDMPQLSVPTRVFQSTQSIETKRPLREGERVYLVQDGCSNSTLKSKQEALVKKAPPLESPYIVTPVRKPYGGITVKRLTPGARVHIYVNDRYHASVDADDNEVFIPLPNLELENAIRVIQTLCTEISHQSNTAFVTLGQMEVSHKPSPIQKGINTLVTVLAVDADDRRDIGGTITIGSNVVGQTNKPFTWNFPVGQGSPTTVINSFGYDSNALSWQLTDPPPPPVNATLTLRLDNNVSNLVLESVEWIVYKFNALNPSNSTKAFQGTDKQEQVILPKPGAGSTETYIYQCLANVRFAGGYVFQTWIRNTNPNDLTTWRRIGWAGNNMSVILTLIPENVYYNGQVIDRTVWIDLISIT